VAPHTAKIHTLITLGIRNRTKPLVLKARKRRPCGFDSHRPLHSQTMPGHAGLQDWGQDIDPMGKSWESTLRGRRSHGPTYPRIAPRSTRTVTHAAVNKNNLCDSHAPLVARPIAGGWTRPLPVRRDRQLSSGAITECLGKIPHVHVDGQITVLVQRRGGRNRAASAALPSRSTYLRGDGVRPGLAVC
jgi:hypothetical protein